MNRTDFDGLKLVEQVEYFNNQLREGMSLTKICDDIGITRKAIRVRFGKAGYVFNKSLNLYEGSILNNGDELKQALTYNKKPSKNKTNTGNTNTIEDRVIALESQIKALEKIVHNNQINVTNTTNASDIELELLEFNADTVTRAYRIYEDVQKDFKIFCKKHSEYKVQDIISTALVEFMNKHK